jgi:hypothetical protein
MRGATRLRAERSIFEAIWRSRLASNCGSSYALYSKHTRKNAPPLHEKNLSSSQPSPPHTTPARNKKYKCQQAVMERVCDEKSGERRGDQLKMATQPVACFRKIFAAQIPPSPQSDQGRSVIFIGSNKATKVENQSSNPSRKMAQSTAPHAPARAPPVLPHPLEQV